MDSRRIRYLMTKSKNTRINIIILCGVWKYFDWDISPGKKFQKELLLLSGILLSKLLLSRGTLRSGKGAATQPIQNGGFSSVCIASCISFHQVSFRLLV